MCSYCEPWIRSWLWKGKVRSSLVQLCFRSLKTNAEKLQQSRLHQIAAVKAKEINCSVNKLRPFLLRLQKL